MTLFEYTMVNTATPNLLAVPDCKLLGSNIPILCHLSFSVGYGIFVHYLYFFVLQSLWLSFYNTSNGF